ncbi:serine/threonine-protein kinase [Nocardioides sp. B-3]|uniref:serine/threonine-protein kinase n=1 Tax=Nocardioides sp. B-3 TaxID=2895565 RepID=UPI00215289F6|nr:serine/threonine-protein kinase [Nocardioides sp. B-3]UUZ59952.1 serine/threonine protein kinase [Nocardioides sp. B-3]
MTTSRPEQAPARAPPGMFVGDYELLTRLGEGGMGVVHLARKPGGDRVALKVLRPHIVGDDEARQRPAREVSSPARVKSRRVAEILDADPWGDIPFVATRYVPGLSLHDHVHEEGAIEGADPVWFATCPAEALAAVHGVGVLHRDIKPSNILMEGRTPILIDFGLARVADDPKLTHTGWLLGTPGYLAPEILFGEDASTASDVHSRGATVAFAGTGRAPFGRGPSMAIMDRVRRGEHDLTDLDPTIRRAVEDTLEPDPRNRPTLDELRDWLATRGPHAAATAPDAAPEDPFTMPLAVAAMAGTIEPTEVVSPTLGPESSRDSGPREPRSWTVRERTATRVLPDGSTGTHRRARRLACRSHPGRVPREAAPRHPRARRDRRRRGGRGVGAVRRDRGPDPAHLDPSQRLDGRQLRRRATAGARREVVRRGAGAARSAPARGEGDPGHAGARAVEPRARPGRGVALLRRRRRDGAEPRGHRGHARRLDVVGAGEPTPARTGATSRAPDQCPAAGVVLRGHRDRGGRHRPRRRGVGAGDELGAGRRPAVR